MKKIIKKHLRQDIKNLLVCLWKIQLKKGTKEQQELYKVCAVLNLKNFISGLTRLREIETP